MVKVAIHQMCSGIDPAENVRKMTQAIAESANQGACFYFAPEMSVLVDRDRARASARVAQEEGNPAIEALAEAARASGIWVHLGSIPVRISEKDSKYANRTLVIDQNGRVAARYDKIHLFDVDLASGERWRESSAYAGGGAPVVVQSPLGPMGLSICYDMRFPALFAELILQVVTVLAVPSAFTVPTGKAHWHALLRARAIEAEAFVIAAAQSGQHEDGRQTYGHSLVVDPWGEVLLDMGEEEGLGFVDLDMDRIAEVRQQIQVHANRREIAPAITMP